MSKVLVTVGRFQTPYLSDGHEALISKIVNQSKHGDIVFIGIGVSHIRLTKTNPLDFLARKENIERLFKDMSWKRNLVIAPIPDTPTDKEWYENLDSLISKTFQGHDITFYGGRNSFLDKYASNGGKYAHEILDLGVTCSATDIRKEIAQTPLYEEQFFNQGIIYAIQNQYPKVYPTVDIALYTDAGEVLLGRKPNESKFRFIGGFVDPADESLEKAALREAKEEANFAPIKWADEKSQVQYISSRKIDDWRYRGTGDTIHTTFFACRMSSTSKIKAGDDIAEVKLVKISHLAQEDLMSVHNSLKQDFMYWAKKNLFKPITLQTLNLQQENTKDV